MLLCILFYWFLAFFMFMSEQNVLYYTLPSFVGVGALNTKTSKNLLFLQDF